MWIFPSIICTKYIKWTDDKEVSSVVSTSVRNIFLNIYWTNFDEIWYWGAYTKNRMLNLIGDLLVKYKLTYKFINTHPFLSLRCTIYLDYLSVQLVYVLNNFNGVYAFLNYEYVVPY